MLEALESKHKQPFSAEVSRAQMLSVLSAAAQGGCGTLQDSSSTHCSVTQQYSPAPATYAGMLDPDEKDDSGKAFAARCVFIVGPGGCRQGHLSLHAAGLCLNMQH